MNCNFPSNAPTDTRTFIPPLPQPLKQLGASQWGVPRKRISIPMQHGEIFHAVARQVFLKGCCKQTGRISRDKLFSPVPEQ